LLASVITHLKSASLGLLALTTIASAFAQTPADVRAPDAPSKIEAARKAEQFVNERLSVWSKRLNLDGWKISAVMTRHEDLKANTLGGIRWDKAKKSAVIKVQDASDYRLPFGDMLKDMEFTIVHELVHLELASLPRSEASRSSEEHAVNQIAEALLRLDRQSSDH